MVQSPITDRKSKNSYLKFYFIWNENSQSFGYDNVYDTKT